MIRSGKDMVQEVRERMQDGKGQVEMTHIFTQDELGSKIRLCARISIPPGGSIGYHPHLGEEEIYYILRGEAIVNDNGDVCKLGPGDAVLTGGGASHSIENSGKENLEFIAVISLFS